MQHPHAYRETLSALLQANRRAELIQLAVDGFLTFVVAQDRADVTLSRTTRSRFLRRLSVSLNVEKQRFNEEQLVSFTRRFATEYDFDIKPIEFIHSFVEKGILHFESEHVQFSLPFIETYLLAVELAANEPLAIQYFQLEDPLFDLATFDIYAEIGASPELVKRLLQQLSAREEALRLPDGHTHILLTDEIMPAFLSRTDRVQALQARLRNAVEDIQNNRSDKERKQRLLDMADQITETATKRSEEAQHGDEDASESDTDFDSAARMWVIATVLLGSGAEHLNAGTKQTLGKALITLAGPILDRWTRSHAAVDFKQVRADLTSDDAIRELMNKYKDDLDKQPDESEVKRLVGTLVDILEYTFLAEPIRRVIGYLCEQARHKVLATSVEKSRVEGEIEGMIYSAWLADIDPKRGEAALRAAIKRLPAALFLRISLASHFLTRVYWSHWKKEDRLLLLDAAEETIRPGQFRLDKGKIKRTIENAESPENKPL